MKRRNLLLGGISAAAVAVVGKNVVKKGHVPEKVTFTEEWNPFDGTTYGVSTSGYRVQQMALAKGFKDRTIEESIIVEHLLKQPWYQDLLREQIMREMNPPMILLHPDGPACIPTPPSAWKFPHDVLIRDRMTTEYGYIDAPYQAKRKAAMDAKFAVDAEDSDA